MRRLGGLALLTLLGLSAAAPAAAQQARRRVAAGEVTGLEMGIEGSLLAVRGGTLRWFVTLYEVVRRRDLRPAPGATLSVTASHTRGAPVTTALTDADGRASLVIPIPDGADAQRMSSLRVVAVSPRGVRRVFAVQLEQSSRYEAELYVDRSAVPPGARVAVFGRVMDRITGRPAVGYPVVVGARRGGPVAESARLTTGPGGGYATTIVMPAAGSPVSIRVTGTDVEGARRQIQVAPPALPSMWLDVTTEPEVASIGATVQVRVLVRDTEGRPLEGARVEGPGIEAPLRTDAAGGAHFPWSLEAGDEGQRSVRVTHPRVGVATRLARVAVQRTPFDVAWSVQGGALAPELPGRVFVRLTGVRGEPLADAVVELDASRLGGRLTGRTDADGVVSFEGVVQEDTGAGRCGGSTATEMAVRHAGHVSRFCVPVDPDAAVVLRAPAEHGAGALAVEVHRRAMVAQRPVEVTALTRRGEEWTPIARTVVGPGARTARLTLPPTLPGELWLRGRPLLDEGRPSLGGSALIWFGAVPRARLTADAEGARWEVASDSERFVYAVESPSASMWRGLTEVAGAGGLRLEGAGPGWFEAALAARTPRDHAASVVVRESTVSIQPLPENPRALGLLRDPWRTRARFVRGRIGRLLRAVESYVDAHTPGQIAECAVPDGRGWRFNHALLEAAMESASITDEMTTTIDGERLDLDGLAAMDSAFTYDRVASRVTRRRMLHVLTALRHFARRRQLDLSWVRRGETAATLIAMLELPHPGQSIERDDLFDAWGRPFVLRRARGAPRFTFLTAIPGWELLSVGPDGREGTADDLLDPFARVLPRGSMYADAVGEEILLARLRGVALGRAAISSLADVLDVDVPHEVRALEARVATMPLRRPSPAVVVGGRLPPLATPLGGVSVAGDVRWSGLAPERRRYDVVGVQWDAQGGTALARSHFEAGAPWAARVELPTTMRPGDSLEVPVQLVRLAEGAPPTVTVQSGRGIEASAEAGAVRLRALAPGRVTVRVRVESEGHVLASIARVVRVLPEGSLRVRHAGRRVSGEARLEVRVPEGDTAWRGELLLTGPRALHHDPVLRATREQHPGLFAWSEVMQGASLDEALSVGVSTRAGTDSMGVDPVEAACALVAWSVTEGAPNASSLRRRLVRHLPEPLEERAAVLAALAAAVSSEPDPSGELERALATLRRDGWRTLATGADRPAAMARMAAALLIVDRDDAPGRALLERAESRLVADASGRRWLVGGDAQPGDAWIGTTALAIAARQAGRDALADELSNTVLSRLYLAPRLGTDGVFWALAAGVYGAFGVETPASVRVSVDGGAVSEVSLEGGHASVALSGDAAITVWSEGSVVARTESRSFRPYREVDEAGLRLAIEGVPGAAGERAALELVVANQEEASMGAPVLEVSLPGAAVLDDAARAQMVGPTVLAISGPDGAGILRLQLAPLAGRATHRIALPIRWVASGSTRGLALTAYDRGRPFHATQLAPTQLEIRAAEPSRGER